MAAVYIHIPYCKQKCNYCNFYSNVAQSVPEQYINAVLRDIQATGGCSPIRPSTIYFGGGTPSLLQPLQVRSIISALCPAPNAEITLEANPESLTQKQAQGYLNAGVNRLSFGVQTVNETSLKTLGRLHTKQQAISAIKAAQNAGFTNISADIMLNLPNYTNEEMNSTIDVLAQCNCTHISAYMLKIEKQTLFFQNTPQSLPNDDESADFYINCVKQLEFYGYMQYEISNFAKKGYESKHNLVYWMCEDYIGFGPTAHSCVNKQRYSVKKGVNSYIKGVQYVNEGKLTNDDYIMLALRLTKGINLKWLKAEHNIELTKKQTEFCNMLKNNGLANFNKDSLSLTVKGMLIQNTILCELLSM